MSRIYVVVTGRDLPQYAERCVESVRWQVGVEPAELVWRDDGSDPAAQGAIRRLVEAAGGTFIAGTQRLYQVGSLDVAIRDRGSPDDIICLLDADDYLLPHALRTVAATYRDPAVAFTWGSCLVELDVYRDMDYFRPGVADSNSPYPAAVWAARSFRSDVFRCFHLRTFRRWLWQAIPREALRRDDGQPIRASGDSAYTYPMLEMLDDARHTRCITDPLYVYRLHPENVWRSDRASQCDDFDAIRRRPPFAPMDRDVLEAHLRRAACAAS